MKVSELIKEGGKQVPEIKNFTHANAMFKRHLLELHKFVKFTKLSQKLAAWCAWGGGSGGGGGGEAAV
jgi:hypothetical protein